MEIFSINKRETSTHLSKKMYINDMCELFGVSSSTISRWVKRKRIVSVTVSRYIDNEQK